MRRPGPSRGGRVAADGTVTPEIIPVGAHAGRRAGAVRRDAERGPESYELTFRLIAGHDRFHLAQAERTLATIRGARG